MKKYDIVVSGYTCVDLIPDFKKTESVSSISNLLKPGKLIEIDGMDLIPGGVVPNTGLAIKKFNKKVFLNGLVGDDSMGKILKNWFESYNISDGIMTTKKAGTAFSIVIAPPGIDRIFLESPGCNKIFDTSFINFEAISQCRLFHFGYPPLLKQFYFNKGSLLADMFAKVQKMGVVTSLDFSLPDSEGESGTVNWPVLMKRILPYTDIFVPSLEEALKIMMPLKHDEIQSLSGDEDILDQISTPVIREIGALIIDSGVKIALIKAGKRGAFLITGDVSSINENTDIKLSEDSWNFRGLWCKAYQVDDSKIVDATGAGDTAVAAFLSAILDGSSVESSLKYAAIAGRNNLYCHNVYTDLSDWHQMTEQIESVPNEIINI